jgi:hypothetical protein
MTTLPTITDRWFGLCPKIPTVRPALATLMLFPETVPAERPDGSGPAGRSLHSREGVSIATGSLKTVARDRHLFWFTILSGLLTAFLIVAESWGDMHGNDTLSFAVTLPTGSMVVYPDPLFFLAEMIWVSGFSFLVTSQALMANGREVNQPPTIHERLAITRDFRWPLVFLSMGMALAATLVFGIITQSWSIAIAAGTVLSAFFSIPYSYALGELYTTLHFWLIITAINFILSLLILWILPVLVLEKRRLVHAITTPFSVMKRKPFEIMGCILVFGGIALTLAAVSLTVGQLPQQLIDHGYGQSMYLGHVVLPIIYYGLILACLILMGAVFAASGVAVADLCRIRTVNGVPGIPERNP